jgi:hypothetical protein
MVDLVPEKSPAEKRIHDRLAELVVAWRSSQAESAAPAIPRFPVRPYPGLRSFLTTESILFFGRRTQAEQLGRRLTDNNVILVVGGSGSGKSSLVKAGLLPNLKTIAPAPNRLGKWYVAECRPRTDPVAEASEALWRDICEPLLADTVGQEAAALGFGIPVESQAPASRIREACKEKLRTLVTRPGTSARGTKRWLAEFASPDRSIRGDFRRKSDRP